VRRRLGAAGGSGPVDSQWDSRSIAPRRGSPPTAAAARGGQRLGGRLLGHERGGFAHQWAPSMRWWWCRVPSSRWGCQSGGPILSQGSAGKPQHEEQRERAGAPESGASKPQVAGSRRSRARAGGDHDRNADMLSPSSHGAFDVAAPCPGRAAAAIGQLAYVSQWDRAPGGEAHPLANRLVIVTARSRSEGDRPSPSQNGR